MNSYRNNRLVLACLLVAALVTLSQAVSLVEKGSLGQSDIGVFYRTCALLNDDIDGELYLRRDSLTGWPICIPPAGLVLFQPLASLSMTQASIVWASCNVLLLCLSVVVVRRSLHAAGLDASSPWAVIVLLVLSAASIQVGQYTLLILSCWILSLAALQSGHDRVAGLLLSLPASIKVYPVLMLAVPFFAARPTRSSTGVLLFFVLGGALWFLVVPLLVYGVRTVDLIQSFLDNVVLNPVGRLADMQSLNSPANQGLDAVLLRYLTYDPPFHDRYMYLPHLNVAKDVVLRMADVLRGIVILTTLLASVRLQRLQHSGSRLLMTAALWSSALCLILPEFKGRYAGYAFFGFLPLLHYTVVSIRPRRTGLILLFTVCFALTIGLMPEQLRVMGIGLLGPLQLWIWNTRTIDLDNTSRGLES